MVSMGIHIADTCIDTPVASGAQKFVPQGGVGMDDLPVCGYCNFVTAARRKCPCRLVRYCDEVCRDRDYPRHKEVCVWRAGIVFLKHVTKHEPFFDPCVVKLLWRFIRPVHGQAIG